MGLIGALVDVVDLVVQVLVWIMVIDAVLTWIPSVDRRHPIVVALRRFTEPIYRPIRRLVPPEKTGYMDLSPLIAILGIQIIWSVVRGILIRVMFQG